MRNRPLPPDLSTLPHRNGKRTGTFTRLSGIDPTPVRWLCHGRIPSGKITVLDGDPGSGKSVLATDLAARLSVGRTFPDGQDVEPAGSILLNAEDDPSDTIRPRLDAAGGDPSRVLVLAGEQHLSLSEDVRVIEGAINDVGAKLVIVDPLMAFFPPGVNTHKDAEVRQALVPVKQLAEKTGAAIVLIRHLNKAGGVNPLYRGGGSIGIIGAARSGLMVGTHPEDETLRVLASQKSNLSEPPPALAYKVVSAAGGAARVEYHGTADVGADSLLWGTEERSQLGEAMKFLRDELGQGPMAAKQVHQRAAAEGIAERTLRRAREAICNKPERSGGEWIWALPGKETRQAGQDP